MKYIFPIYANSFEVPEFKGKAITWTAELPGAQGGSVEIRLVK
jgi:hypothetical protein